MAKIIVDILVVVKVKEYMVATKDILLNNYHSEKMFDKTVKHFFLNNIL